MIKCKTVERRSESQILLVCLVCLKIVMVVKSRNNTFEALYKHNFVFRVNIHKDKVITGYRVQFLYHDLIQMVSFDSSLFDLS